MTDRERFVAVARGEPYDYVPIFGHNDAPGVSAGCMKKAYDRLVATGMPDVGGCWDVGGDTPDLEGWYRYWGTTGPVEPGFFPAAPARGIASERRVEDGFEIIEYETGARTRQVIDNDITYSMPDFQAFHVRDRASWRFFLDRASHGPRWSADRLEAACRPLDARKRPLEIHVGSTWGAVRSLMGPEAGSLVLYDDPGLAAEIVAHEDHVRRTYLYPLIERLRPEILVVSEDNCYRGGMLISPRHFRELCMPSYREIAGVARDCGVAALTVDSDGNVMELVPLLAECGANAILPCEVKAGNDLFALRRRFPQFVFLGWLEKETLNEGNDGLIRRELESKVPAMLAAKRYFPNGDHGIQPLATFPNLCRFLTLLHELTGNPEGEFPRLPPD